MRGRVGWAVGLLFGAACAGGAGTPAPTTPRPAASAPVTVPVPVPVALPPAGEAIQYPRSGSGRARYAFYRRDSIEVTMPSGESQLQQTASTAYLTIAWSAADSSTRIEAAVDSITTDPTFPVPRAQLDSAREAQWALRQAPSGEITGIVGQPAAFRAEQIRDQLLLLYPLLPGGGARAGMEWEDSTTAPTRLSAFPAQAAIHARTRAEDLAGAGLRLTIARARTATGDGTQFGQAITVRATGTDSLTTELDRQGLVLSTEVHRVTDFVVDLSAIGQSVPGREVSFLRMELLR